MRQLIKNIGISSLILFLMVGLTNNTFAQGESNQDKPNKKNEAAVEAKNNKEKSKEGDKEYVEMPENDQKDTIKTNNKGKATGISDDKTNYGQIRSELAKEKMREAHQKTEEAEQVLLRTEEKIAKAKEKLLEARKKGESSEDELVEKEAKIAKAELKLKEAWDLIKNKKHPGSI